MTVALIIGLWWAALASAALSAALIHAIVSDLREQGSQPNLMGTIVATVALLLLLQNAAVSGWLAWGLSS